MEFSTYQSDVVDILDYFKTKDNLSSTLGGLYHEVQVLMNKHEKVIRRDSEVLSPQSVRELSEKLGNILLFITLSLKELSVDLDYVAMHNLMKLQEMKYKKQQHENTKQDIQLSEEIL